MQLLKILQNYKCWTGLHVERKERTISQDDEIHIINVSIETYFKLKCIAI